MCVMIYACSEGGNTFGIQTTMNILPNRQVLVYGITCVIVCVCCRDSYDATVLQCWTDAMGYILSYASCSTDTTSHTAGAASCTIAAWPAHCDRPADDTNTNCDTSGRQWHSSDACYSWYIDRYLRCLCFYTTIVCFFVVVLT